VSAGQIRRWLEEWGLVCFGTAWGAVAVSSIGLLMQARQEPTRNLMAAPNYKATPGNVMEQAPACGTVGLNRKVNYV
jgi:hypothetical protein